MCGPWVLPSGDEFTHTQSEASPIEPWAQTLSLNTLGVNTVIAHLRYVVDSQIPPRVKGVTYNL